MTLSASLPPLSIRWGKKRKKGGSVCSPAKCYKDTLCNETSAHLTSACLRRAGSNLGEGLAGRAAGRSAGRNAAELRGKHWRWRPVLVQREKSIFQSPSRDFFFPVCSSYVKPGSEWPLEGEREKKKKKLMPNFFICVLLPRVVPPNQYTIHKYHRAPCSRQSGDESLRVSLLHTSWLPEEGKNNFQAIVQSVLRKAGFSLKSLVLCILLSWIQWSRISYFN